MDIDDLKTAYDLGRDDADDVDDLIVEQAGEIERLKARVAELEAAIKRSLETLTED